VGPSDDGILIAETVPPPGPGGTGGKPSPFACFRGALELPPVFVADLRGADFLPEDFFAADFLPDDFFAADFLDELLRAAVRFLPPPFFAAPRFAPPRFAPPRFAPPRFAPPRFAAFFAPPLRPDERFAALFFLAGAFLRVAFFAAFLRPFFAAIGRLLLRDHFPATTRST
jgi:hypothetical protein